MSDRTDADRGPSTRNRARRFAVHHFAAAGPADGTYTLDELLDAWGAGTPAAFAVER